MGASASEGSIGRVQIVAYDEDRPFEAAAIIEKASSLSLSSEKSQEKTVHVNVHEGSTPLGPESQQSYLVDWDGEADQTHPQNWQRRRKWIVMALGLCSSLVRSTSDFADAVQSPHSPLCRL
jgi:hypothetical protein